MGKKNCDDIRLSPDELINFDDLEECPDCGSTDVKCYTYKDGEDADGNRGWLVRECTCQECGEVWSPW